MIFAVRAVSRGDAQQASRGSRAPMEHVIPQILELTSSAAPPPRRAPHSSHHRSRSATCSSRSAAASPTWRSPRLSMSASPRQTHVGRVLAKPCATGSTRSSWRTGTDSSARRGCPGPGRRPLRDPAEPGAPRRPELEAGNGEEIGNLVHAAGALDRCDDRRLRAEPGRVRSR